MASRMEMNRKDMEELYQLLCMYRMTYPANADDATILVDNLELRYREVYGLEISHARNPRNAGRKRKYTEEMDQGIVELRRDKHSLREIARETGCSLGRVQKVLNKHGVF